MTANKTAYTPPQDSQDVEACVDAAVERAHEWLKVTKGESSRSTEQLADMVRDPDGVSFTMDFVDRVMRPEDNKVAAQALAELAESPEFLSKIDALMVGAGGFFGPILPNLVMPVARRRMRQMVGHLVLDAESDALNKMLDDAAERGQDLNLNLLGEAVLGEEEAKSRFDRTMELVRNPRVTYVSVKASSLCAQLNHWDHDGSVERLKDRLRPMYREAISRKPQVFINLDMEEYHDLHLTIRLFKELLSEDEFKNLEAGIVVQAYLPDAFEALQELAEFAVERVKNGGAPIKVRIVKGANLSLERVESEVHGWPLAPYLSKAEVDANYIRLLDYILRDEYADAIRIGVASHNLFTMGLAVELAEKRGVSRQIDAEMLAGMSPAQAKAVHDVVGRQILYTPVVHMKDFDVAVSYLVRRLEENAESQNFLYALFAPDEASDKGKTPMQDQQERFHASVRDRWKTFAGQRRQQDRNNETGRQTPNTGRFINEPDTDPSLRANREWALEALASDPGEHGIKSVTEISEVDDAISTAVGLADDWAALSGAQRCEVLNTIGDELAKSRGKLISVAAWEAGKAVDQTDPEISEAIDFATYYGQQAIALDRTQSVFTPNKLTVVVPPWNFPIAIPVGGITAALAAGSAVIIKPAPQVVHCAKVAVDAIRAGLEAAGQNPDLVQLVNTDEGEAGKHLISHEKTDAVVLTGASDTGALFRSWKPDMNIYAETSGKNAMIITPACDPDLAVQDLYKSAFGHSGQKCSASSLAILVGSLKDSDRVKNQLVDAVKTLKPGFGTDISVTMNGLVEEPNEKLYRGLTYLEPGEKWLLKPEKLNEEGTLWSPGIRDNVQPGSWYHQNECFGPVLGIMYAETLEEAIEWQNSTGYGLTGGIHSLNDDEVEYWMDNVEVGNAYVNRGITGAIVQRQSFGGWKNSVLGPGAKAGGPNYVRQFGTWSEGELEHHKVEISPRITRLLKDLSERLDSQLSDEDINWLWRAAELDAKNWHNEFGRSNDYTGLVSEANIFRYRPFWERLRVRVGKGYKPREVARQILASKITGVELNMSATREIAEELQAMGFDCQVANTNEFAAELGGVPSTRVRAIGEVEPEAYRAAVKSESVIIDWEVLADGRRELLPYLLEQAVSVTMHRFGIVRPTGHIQR